MVPGIRTAAASYSLACSRCRSLASMVSARRRFSAPTAVSDVPLCDARGHQRLHERRRMGLR